MNKNFKSNMDFIKKNYPDFEKIIKKSSSECSWFKKIENNYYVISDNNESVLLYNDLKNDIKNLLSKIEFYEDEATILIGIGSGDLLYDILKKKHKKHIIVVIEPEISLLKSVLEKFDLAKYFEKNNLCLIINENEIHTVLSLIDSYSVLQEWHILTEPYTLHKPSIYQMSAYLSNKTITQMLCNSGTICGAGKVIVENEIRTLPYILSSPGINVLKNIFKDKPAVIVNTGPSLRKNVHKLIEYQDQIIIIAVAQALRILLSYGITPDFICTVDYGEVNITHFNGLMDCDVPVVALNKTWYPILQQYKGQKFIAVSGAAGFENTLNGILADRGSLEQGGSVSHFAFGLAIHMGCNVIMLIGQDLALTESSHDPNADSMGKITIKEDGMIYWKVDDPNSPILTNQESCMGPVVASEGYYGDIVFTNIGLDSFKTAFEHIFKQYTDKIILNCTQGGVHIKGTKRKALEFALKECCKDTIYKKNIIKFTSFYHYEKINEENIFRNAIEILEKDLSIIKKIKQNCNAALNYNKMLNVNAKTWDTKRTKKILHENKVYTNKAYKLVLTNPLIQTYIYNTSRLIQSRSIKGKGRFNHLEKNKDNRKLRVDRNKMILDSVISAADELELHYNGSLNLMKEYKVTGKKELLTENEGYVPDIKDIEEYFNQGNWAHPWTILQHLDIAENFDFLKVTLEKCTNMRKEAIKKSDVEMKDDDKKIEYVELIQEAQKIGHDNDEFIKAEKLLLQSIEIFPDRFEARWGLASAYFMNKKINDALIEFKELIKDFPDNKQIIFEYGMVLLNFNAKEGIEYIEKFLNENDTHQYFYKELSVICKNQGLYEESEKFSKIYNEKYPFDTIKS